MKTQLLSLIFAALFQISTACIHHLVKSESCNPGRDISTGKPVRVALNNVRVFDGQRIRGPETVVIDGEFIGSKDTKVDLTIDASGGFLIPGLIDSHVHPPDVSGMQNLTSYGVTTAFNMACRNYTLCHSLRHLPGLAAFISAGLPAIGPNSSHATWQKLPADQLFYSPDQAPYAVAAAFGNGSDFFKITAEKSGPSLASQIKLVQDCHARHKQSMTHAADFISYQQAITSGTDGIQHMPSDQLITKEMIASIIKQGQFVTPTINIFKAALTNPAILDFLGEFPGNSANASALAAEFAKNVTTVIQNVHALHKAGVTILAGTDAIGHMGVFNVPLGLSLHLELQNLVEAGLTPAEALRAATIVPAIFHQVPDRGMIAPGKRADLILLNSNPLANISNTLDIAKVWVGGIEYPFVA
jgi:imidazolonepropionase-like amidohydrolase